MIKIKRASFSAGPLELVSGKMLSNCQMPYYYVMTFSFQDFDRTTCILYFVRSSTSLAFSNCHGLSFSSFEI